MAIKKAKKHLEIDFDLYGVTELQETFRALGFAQQKRAWINAAKKAIEPVLSLAKATSPRNTGRMARSLRIKTYSTKTRGFGARISTGSRGALGIPRNANYYYPAAMEYGSKKITARNFLANAISAMRSRVESRLADELHKTIEVEWVKRKNKEAKKLV